MKITVVGGGSTYTPELVAGLGQLRAELPVNELFLLDPDRERLDIVGGFARPMLAHHQGLNTELTLTQDRTVALRESDAVLI